MGGRCIGVGTYPFDAVVGRDDDGVVDNVTAVWVYRLTKRGFVCTPRPPRYLPGFVVQGVPEAAFLD